MGRRVTLRKWSPDKFYLSVGEILRDAGRQNPWRNTESLADPTPRGIHWTGPIA